MKFLGRFPYYLLVLALFAACGKDNKSGTSGVNSPYGLSPLVSPYVAGNGQSVNSVIAENPCKVDTGYSTYPGQPYPGGTTGGYHQNRYAVDQQLTNFPTVIPAGDFYVGVTSFGDVVTIAGNGTNAPIMNAYVCPRGGQNLGGTVQGGVALAPYTNCAFKQISALTLVFQGGYGYGSLQANFRMMDFGTSTGQKFSASLCR